MNPHIIAGSRKHIILDVPASGTRPMTNRVKSALFSIIQPKISKSTILDLFAGSGALGLEGLSRGARAAVFVDNNPEAVNVIKRNIEKTKFEKESQVISADAKNVLQHPEDYKIEDGSFDIIFICPPHKDVSIDFVLDSVRFIQQNGIIIGEYPKGFIFETIPDSMERIDSRVYGETGFDIFMRK